MAVSLSTLRTRVRREADIENATTRHPDAELTDYINDGIKSLMRKLGVMDPAGYLRARATASTVAGTATIAFAPTTYKALLGIDVDVGGETFQAHPLDHYDRNLFDEADGWQPTYPVYYQVEPATIRFFPTPTGVHTVTLWYVPAATVLTNATDEVEDFGFAEYIVLFAAIAVGRRDEDEISEKLIRLQQLELEIVAEGYRRDRTGTKRVRDVRRAPPLRKRWAGGCE